MDYTPNKNETNVKSIVYIREWNFTNTIAGCTETTSTLPAQTSALVKATLPVASVTAPSLLLPF